MVNNLILRKGTSFLLTLTLILSGFFLTPNDSSAGTTMEIQKKSVDIYDLAYYDVWKHEDGTWQNGKKPGSSVSQNYTITESIVPQGAKITKFSYEFNYAYSGAFLNLLCQVEQWKQGIMKLLSVKSKIITQQISIILYQQFLTQIQEC